MNPLVKIKDTTDIDIFININHITAICQIDGRNGCYIDLNTSLRFGDSIESDKNADEVIKMINEAIGPRKCYSFEYPDDIYKFHKFIESGNNVKALVENEDGMLKMLYYHEVVFIDG